MRRPRCALRWQTATEPLLEEAAGNAEDSPHPSLVLTFPVAQEMLSRQGPGQEGP